MVLLCIFSKIFRSKKIPILVKRPNEKRNIGKTIDRCQTPDILKIFPNSILIADIPDIFQNQ